MRLFCRLHPDRGYFAEFRRLGGLPPEDRLRGFIRKFHEASA